MTPKFPFEASLEDIRANPEIFVSSVNACLESEFLVLPKGAGFVEYPIFETGYEALKKASSGFTRLKASEIVPAILSVPISLIVLRSMLGFTPSEWAYVTTQRTEIEVTQGFARTVDRKIRMAPKTPLKHSLRLEAMIQTACELLNAGSPPVASEELHRLNKADTWSGLEGVRRLVQLGVPYPVVLYERFLGRPFASHRDSVSELVGDVLELEIEKLLTNAGVSYRKTKRAERIDGFDQAPDFVIPSEFNVQAVIEAKVTEDDGTARDKITRIQHLERLSLQGQPRGEPKFEVIACISGRGFGVRPEDMKKLLLATRGKVFTLKTLGSLVESTRLAEFKTR